MKEAGLQEVKVICFELKTVFGAICRSCCNLRAPKNFSSGFLRYFFDTSSGHRLRSHIIFPENRQDDCHI